MHSRLFESQKDLHKMRALLTAGRRAAGHYAGFWHVGDLTWRYFLLSFRADPCLNIRLWEDERGAMIGYAVFGDDLTIDWQIHPDHSWRGIEEKVMAWAQGRWTDGMNDPAIPPDRKRPLSSNALEMDTRRCAFLERHGFVQEQGGMINFLCSLDGRIAEPTLPEGFAVRGVAGEHEAPNRAGAHREAFQPSRVTDEGYVRLMNMPEYRRDLDVVAVSPEGVIAAYAMSWIDEENQVGEFEPVGARPAFRRRGLTRAVLLEGLRRMQGRGADTAIVSTGESNQAAVRLYESVGFHRVGNDLNYARLQGAQP